MVPTSGLSRQLSEVAKAFSTALAQLLGGRDGILTGGKLETRSPLPSQKYAGLWPRRISWAHLHVICMSPVEPTTLVTPVASEPLDPTLSLSLPRGFSQTPEGWRTPKGEESPSLGPGV